MLNEQQAVCETRTRASTILQLERIDAVKCSEAGGKCLHCDGWGYSHVEDGLPLDLEQHQRCNDCSECEKCEGAGVNRPIARASSSRRTLKGGRLPGLPGGLPGLPPSGF